MRAWTRNEHTVLERTIVGSDQPEARKSRLAARTGIRQTMDDPESTDLHVRHKRNIVVGFFLKNLYTYTLSSS